jgi:hypothetical protein
MRPACGFVKNSLNLYAEPQGRDLMRPSFPYGTTTLSRMKIRSAGDSEMTVWPEPSIMWVVTTTD